ncbi:MAG: arylsulfatase [Planctomycetaceae bacterium]|nr:arylsulfatase [Planctomycetaceae bacterium]
MRKVFLSFLLCSLAVSLTSFAFASTQTEKLPNIVFILADDLGRGDLGCYGQTKIKTPNIDSLAASGMKFTRHYSGNNVCAPSRAVLMTGMHPGHCVIRNNSEVQPEGQRAMPENTPTLVGELKKRGYVVGGFGKWGLGYPGSVSSPTRIGFDKFFGYNCQRVAHSFYPEYLWDNDTKVIINEHPVPGHGKLPEGADVTDVSVFKKFQGQNYSSDIINAKLLEFVEENAEKPFFLYWPTTVPHVALQVPEDSLKEYEGLWDDPPYLGNNGYVPHHAPRAAYAAMITRFDRAVGKLIALLKEKGIYGNTIIVFTSDNGATHDAGGVDSNFFNSTGGLRSRKGNMYEGGICAPCIVVWKGKVVAGSTTDRVSGFEDWMPTFLDIVDTASQKAVDKPKVDGISILPTLLGKKQEPRPFLYRESSGYGGQQTVIVGDWKAVRTELQKAARQNKTIKDVKTELYNLAEDLFETNDVAAKFPEKLRELEEIMAREHVYNEVFPMPLLDPK